MASINFVCICMLIFATSGSSAVVSAAAASSSSIQMYDTNIFPKHCLQKRAIESNYRPTGFEWTFDDNLRVYETRTPKNASRVLFAVYDVFGFHPSTKQVVDKIAEAGRFRVVMPDFFRGGWPLTDFPPANQAKFQEFLNQNGSWEGVNHNLQGLIHHYKTKFGVTKFGIFGFCWGGKVSILASALMSPDFKAAGLIHPSSVVTEDANTVEIPMYLLPSKDESDMIPFYNILVENLGQENAGHTRFDDMHHGFAGARADYSNELNRQRVDEVIEILQTFFNKHLGSGAESGRITGTNLAISTWYLLLLLIFGLRG